jgi:predicted nucleotidyltransferase
MITEAELRILSDFFPNPQGLMTRTLESKTGYSHERVHTTLKNLLDKEVIEGEKIGKTWSYSLNLEEDLCFLAFIHYAINKKRDFANRNKKVAKLLKEFLQNIDAECAVVFGSYAKGIARHGSDIDLLVVSPSEELEKRALSLRHKYNIRLNPARVLSLKAVSEENETFFKEIKEHGVILKGFEYFFNQVYR